MSKTRCFVFDRCKQDVSSAGEYGEIIYVFKEKFGRSSVWSSEYKREVIEAMLALDYDPDVDFLVIVGHQIPVITGLCAMIAFFGEINALMYYPPEQRYRPVLLGDDVEVRSNRAS